MFLIVISVISYMFLLIECLRLSLYFVGETSDSSHLSGPRAALSRHIVVSPTHRLRCRKGKISAQTTQTCSLVETFILDMNVFLMGKYR